MNTLEGITLEELKSLVKEAVVESTIVNTTVDKVKPASMVESAIEAIYDETFKSLFAGSIADFIKGIIFFLAYQVVAYFNLYYVALALIVLIAEECVTLVVNHLK